MSKTNQPDLFNAGEQPDLFGAPAPTTYTPEPQHVLNRLETLLGQMQGSETWPWPEAMVELHRSKTFEYLCGLLPESEAAKFRAAILAQIERLDPPAEAAE